jgi:16S rRNA (uracil1498-N3)-methyltransferase
MPNVNFRTPRLFVDKPLGAGGQVELDRNQANYVGNVMRLAPGDAILVFNGRDGEWRAEVGGEKRRDRLLIVERTRAQERLANLAYVFAPLKHARLDYMVQKAVEMGVSRLTPVITRHTQVTRVNTERMRANVIEAAEQCGILELAEVDEARNLSNFLRERAAGRLLVFCDEATDAADPLKLLEQADRSAGIDVLIGPEGGFEASERAALLEQKMIVRLPLGPRILRADTAAVAALTLVQAKLGDWRLP